MSNNFRDFQYTASVAGYPDYIIRKDDEKRRLKKLKKIIIPKSLKEKKLIC